MIIKFNNKIFEFDSPLLTWQLLQRKTLHCCLDLDLLRYLQLIWKNDMMCFIHYKIMLNKC